MMDKHSAQKEHKEDFHFQFKWLLIEAPKCNGFCDKSFLGQDINSWHKSHFN